MSRVIGVEVLCGPIDGVFLYTTDNMISSGGNIMIEVQRQGIIHAISIYNLNV
jgi:hypothetical protein